MSARPDDIDPDTRARLGIDGALDITPPRRTTPDKKAQELFAQQLSQFRLPPFRIGYRFPKSSDPDNKRKVWIADFCSVEYKLMVEIDGGVWSGDGHGHPVGITRDMRKQNDAALLGYHTLRFETSWVKPKHAINFLQRVLHSKGWKPDV